jgi:hypothetical protein
MENTTENKTATTTTTTTTVEEHQTRAEFLYSRVQVFYNRKYYWETVKSVILFLLGLKIAQECYHIVIPIKDYEPFNGICGGRK